MFAWALLALALLACDVASAAAVAEHRLKAAFLYNFTKFVEWPPERFDSATAPIVIGLLAEANLEAEIAGIVANRQVNGRALIVRNITSAADIQTVHVLFVSTEQETRFVALRQHARPAALLTVGDEEACRTYGGIICFMQRGEKLRFEIDIDAAERSHLKISAQLQKLAVAVHKGS